MCNATLTEVLVESVSNYISFPRKSAYMPIARFLLHFEVKGNTGFFVFIAIDKLHLSSLAAYRILHKRRSCPDSHRSCIRMSISKLLLIHFPWNRKIQPSTPSPTVTHLILCVFHTHQNNDLLPR